LPAQDIEAAASSEDRVVAAASPYVLAVTVPALGVVITRTETDQVTRSKTEDNIVTAAGEDDIAPVSTADSIVIGGTPDGGCLPPAFPMDLSGRSGGRQKSAHQEKEQQEGPCTPDHIQETPTLVLWLPG
jgi:hypothetical protein